jgi:phosphoglycolate phosphatase-like HAD superfamily hydrolase
MAAILPETSKRRLILFDIDGTLVDVHGAGRRSFAEALRLAWGVDDDLADVVFAGATDMGVLRQLRAKHALPEEQEAQFFAEMEGVLARLLVDERPFVYDGVHDCLRAWASTTAMLGLLTGNGRKTANVKLELAGVHRGWFDVGGYGDEHHDRRELARLAVSRAERGMGLGYGDGFDVVVVGDTPSDIDAALAISATAVGVTTGHFGRGALEAAGAHVVVDSLADFLPTA